MRSRAVIGPCGLTGTPPYPDRQSLPHRAPVANPRRVRLGVAKVYRFTVKAKAPSVLWSSGVCIFQVTL